LFLAGAFVNCGEGVPREFLPTDHWAYEDLESLWTEGQLESLNLAVKPWSRIEIATALAGALADSEGDRDDPRLQRLLREFATELSWLNVESGFREPSPLVQVEEPNARFRCHAGGEFLLAGAPPDKAQLQAGSGIFVRAKAYIEPGLYVGTEVRAHRTGVTSDRNIGDSLIKSEDLFLDTREAYFSLSSSYIDVTTGFTETRWGPGRSGTLLLSDAAPPYATLRLHRAIAGRLFFDALTGILVQGDERQLAAHRLTWRISRTLWLGVAEAARYDARSPELLYVINLIPYTVVERVGSKYREKVPDTNPRNNVMWSADVVWRPAPGTRLYAEYLLDDLATETADMPHRMAFQAGIGRNLRAGRVPLEISAEFTKIFRFVYSTYYGRDFVYGNRPLGFAEGPDTELYALSLTADLQRDWRATIGLAWLRRGEGTIGEAWQPGTDYDAWDGAKLSGEVSGSLRGFVTARWTPLANCFASLTTGFIARTEDGPRRVCADKACGELAVSASYYR
jgi:hypothetical protein